jgi:hypothetical protein
MTDERMALIELIEKGADADLIRDMLARDHCPCGVVVLPVSSEPAADRGDAARARHRRVLRDGSSVGAEVWDGVRSPPQAQDAKPPGHLALG